MRIYIDLWHQIPLYRSQSRILHIEMWLLRKYKFMTWRHAMAGAVDQGICAIALEIFIQLSGLGNVLGELALQPN